MGVVAKEVKSMSQENILAFEKAGEVTIASHCLKLTDIKVFIFCSYIFSCSIHVKVSLRVVVTDFDLVWIFSLLGQR